MHAAKPPMTSVLACAMQAYSSVCAMVQCGAEVRALGCRHALHAVRGGVHLLAFPVSRTRSFMGLQPPMQLSGV